MFNQDEVMIECKTCRYLPYKDSLKFMIAL